MGNNGSVDIVCRYRVKPGKATEFEALLGRHWKTLYGLGLSTDEPARLLRAGDQAGNVAFLEMFAWKDGDSAQTAHETAAVMELWEPMGALCDDMEFWQVSPIDG